MEHVQIPAEPVETPTFPPWERQSVPVQLQKSTRARKTAVAPETRTSAATAVVFTDDSQDVQDQDSAPEPPITE